MAAALALVLGGDPQGSLRILESTLAECAPGTSCQVQALKNMGVAYTELDQMPKALECYELAVQVLHEVRDRSGEADMQIVIGGLYYHLGQMQSAAEHWEHAVQILHETGDRSGEATVLSNIGFAYSALGETQKASEHFELAVRATSPARSR